MGAMIHGMTVPGAIEAAQRTNGFTSGVFDWLRKAPWGNPAFAGMFLSLVMFGFLGGISGVVLGTEQLNIMMHNTLYVPGHFHATVVAGTTLAFMAATYLVVPLVFQREIMLPKLAKIQPYCSAIGAAGISLFMMGAGTLGVSRRHWDITFRDAHDAVRLSRRGVPDDGAQRPRRRSSRRLGGALYVVIVVCEHPVRQEDRRDERRGFAWPDAEEGRAGRGRHLRQRRNLAAAGHLHPGRRLLPAFVLYYFVNWKYLSELWPMGEEDSKGSNAAAAPEAASTRDVISIFKLRIGVAIMISAIGGVAITPGPMPRAWRVALLLAWPCSWPRPAPAPSTSGPRRPRPADAAHREPRRSPADGFRPTAPGWPSSSALLAASLALAARSAMPGPPSTRSWAPSPMASSIRVWLKRRSWSEHRRRRPGRQFRGARRRGGGRSGAASTEAVLLARGAVPVDAAAFLEPRHRRAGRLRRRQGADAAGGRRQCVTAMVILVHTVALAAVSLVPALHGRWAGSISPRRRRRRAFRLESIKLRLVLQPRPEARHRELLRLAAATGAADRRRRRGPAVGAL